MHKKTKSLLLIPVVPGVALGGGFLLNACAPPRGGSSGSGSGSDDDDATEEFSIIGDWELTRYGSYDYPYVYTDAYDCVMTTAIRMSVESDFEVEERGESTEDGAECTGFGVGSWTYDGTWSEIAPGAWRIEFEKSLTLMTCSLDDNGELECEDEDGTVREYERG